VIAGRALGVFPRTVVKSGYADLDADDFKEGDFMKYWDGEVNKAMLRDQR
jgi:hypothetical protein